MIRSTLIRKSIRRSILEASLTLLLTLGLLLPPPVTAQVATSPEARDLVERILTSVGGREVWAGARGFRMLEILHAEGLPLPAIREYWVDFESPRIMERTQTANLVQLQALNGTSGWRVRNGELADWPPEMVAGFRSFWPGIPTRVFHLLASNDPSVRVEYLDGDRLDVFVDGEFAVWIAAAPDGRPVAYGRNESHTETHFLGRPESYGPVTLWSTAYEPGDSWRVVMVDYVLFPEGQEYPVSWAPPADLAEHRPGEAGVGG